MHGTTIVGVRKGGSVTIAGDGQVSLGNTIIKGTAQKIRSIKNDEYEVIIKFGPKLSILTFSDLKVQTLNFSTIHESRVNLS